MKPSSEVNTWFSTFSKLGAKEDNFQWLSCNNLADSDKIAQVWSTLEHNTFLIFLKLTFLFFYIVIFNTSESEVASDKIRLWSTPQPVSNICHVSCLLFFLWICFKHLKWERLNKIHFQHISNSSFVALSFVCSIPLREWCRNFFAAKLEGARSG